MGSPQSISKYDKGATFCIDWTEAAGARVTDTSSRGLPSLSHRVSPPSSGLGTNLDRM